jgi:hypothetical protein
MTGEMKEAGIAKVFNARLAAKIDAGDEITLIDMNRLFLEEMRIRSKLTQLRCSIQPDTR